MFDIDTLVQMRAEDRAEEWDIFLTDQKGVRRIRKLPISSQRKIKLRKELKNKMYPPIAIEGLSEEALNATW